MDEHDDSCTSCMGTGIGVTPDHACGHCRGSGIEPRGPADGDDYDGPDNFDEDDRYLAEKAENDWLKGRDF